MALDSKLRACDLVKLRLRDIAQGEPVAARAIVMQQTKLGSTVRYLAIEVDDAVEMAEQTEV